VSLSSGQQAVSHEKTLRRSLSLHEGQTVSHDAVGVRESFQSIELGIQFSRKPEIIIVEESDELSARDAQASVPCGACPATLGRAQQTDSGSKLFRNDLGSVVCRPVIDDDDFYLARALAESAFNRFPDEAGAISGGNYD
jgi:hypothetical protein